MRIEKIENTPYDDLVRIYDFEHLIKYLILILLIILVMN